MTALTEGALIEAQRSPHAPSTMLRMVPLPFQGRILAASISNNLTSTA